MYSLQICYNIYHSRPILFYVKIVFKKKLRNFLNFKKFYNLCVVHFNVKFFSFIFFIHLFLYTNHVEWNILPMKVNASSLMSLYYIFIVSRSSAIHSWRGPISIADGGLFRQRRDAGIDQGHPSVPPSIPQNVELSHQSWMDYSVAYTFYCCILRSCISLYLRRQLYLLFLRLLLHIEWTWWRVLYIPWLLELYSVWLSWRQPKTVCGRPQRLINRPHRPKEL